MSPEFRKVFFILLGVVAVIAVIVLISNPFQVTTTEIGWSQVQQWLEDDKITSLSVGKDEQTIVLEVNGTKYTTTKERYLVISDLINDIDKQRAAANPALAPLRTDVAYERIGGFQWGDLLINLLPILFLVGLLILLMRRAGAGAGQAFNFSKSRARLVVGNKPNVTFDDVAGVDEAKEELREIVDFLKSPEKFTSIGARIPRGVLLVGSPGTGKTLMSRAVAGEAGVPFFSISGSEFVEMFVGVGASRVRDLFEQAKRASPSIVFIDEIDAVGRHRGSGMGGGHDEREQTLNQILVEMDGFDTSTNVIVIAATNRPDILDPALLRPGRFDRRVVLDRPDINGRKAIIKVHAKNKPLGPDADLETLAKQTPGFTGADLANLINEASILTARRGKKIIGMSELEEARDRVAFGPQRKSRLISPKEKEITAYHESGHALVAKKLKHSDPLHKVTIIPRGYVGGYTELLPTEDRYMQTEKQLKDEIASGLGGRAAEQIVFDEVTSGATQDLKEVTALAKRMVKELGMSRQLGPRTFGHKEELVYLGRIMDEQKDYGDKIADEIDKEINILIETGYKTAYDILLENKDRLIYLAKRLIEVETLEGADLEAALNDIIPPQVNPVN
ncbi:MAG: ATP-dependent zinc metalloprotease FtsH [Chloroflexi bacterium]|nr:ATP-dependent zinc metalloprotease FtsH [Chloroflexota bacterium]